MLRATETSSPPSPQRVRQRSEGLHGSVLLLQSRSWRNVWATQFSDRPNDIIFWCKYLYIVNILIIYTWICSLTWNLYLNHISLRGFTTHPKRNQIKNSWYGCAWSIRRPIHQLSSETLWCCHWWINTSSRVVFVRHAGDGWWYGRRQQANHMKGLSFWNTGEGKNKLFTVKIGSLNI